MKRWYIVQVLAGYEEAFKKDVLSMSQKAGFGDFVDDVFIPTRKKNEEDKQGEKIYPGYVAVHADMTGGEFASFLSKVPRFYKFIGGTPPVPLKNEEVVKLLEGASKVLKASESTLSVGSEVKVVGGPFNGVIGIVESVDSEEQKVKVSVSIFGRMTSISVSMDHIEV